MSRIYTQLKCGCLISCDGGGGLMSGCGSFNVKKGIWEESKDCKVQEYLKEHKSDNYYCPICNPTEYKEEVMGYMKNIHTLIITKFPDKKEKEEETTNWDDIKK